MPQPSRPPNRSDGSSAVMATEESGDPPAGDPRVSAQTSRSNGGTDQSSVSPSRGRTRSIAHLDSLSVFHTRSIFQLPRRSSSGYFSSDGDSLPSSPLSPRPVTADKATQTPSLTSQVMNHALQRLAEAHGGGAGAHRQHGGSPCPSSTRQQNAARDMPTQAVGQELRQLGDEFNRLLLLRGAADRPIPQPPIHREPAVLLCVGILLLVIGRIVLQGYTNNQYNSQV
ncbi:bcl-2-like protein 11 isoform X2 [Mastacembelus armatus]|uniref:bcl-2-like protein 11 isoform X2 n=1 Tax=Mastacembelus armatus TaxID=205130 RepID=UPI000E455D86|nr:bcl-2-like protein 11 isoform X2 [Mastacembelus armatus]